MQPQNITLTSTKYTLRHLLLFLFACVGIFALAGCEERNNDHDHKTHKEDKHEEKGHDEHKGEITLHKEALKQIALTTYTLRAKSNPTQEVAAVGRISLPPSTLSQVGSRVEGRLLKWYVKLGQKVKKGQSLALLDSPTAGRARATYLRAKALYKLTDTEYQRTTRLKKIGLASSRQRLAARMAREKARINVRSAQTQLHILGIATPTNTTQKISGRFILRAPKAGEISRLNKTLGAWVHPQHPLLHIEDRRKVWALLEVYARDVPYIHVGQSVHIYGPGIQSHRKGRVEYLSSRFDRGARTLEARVSLPNPKGTLRPNQFVYALIDGNEKKTTSNTKQLLLPEDAIQRLGQRHIAFIVGDELGHFTAKTVVTVEAPGGQVRVLYGLKEGDKVVVKGSFILKSELLRSSLEGGHGHAH